MHPFRAAGVDAHALGADHVLRRVHVVDEGQRHLVDVGALVRQVLAVLAPDGGGGGRGAHPRWTRRAARK